MERFKNQLQVRLAREQLKWQRREARWVGRQLKLDLRSVKPVDAGAVERFKTSIKKAVVVKPKKKPIKAKITKPRVKKPKAEIPEVKPKPREIVIVEEKPRAEPVKLPTEERRYRCIMCGTISPEPSICCGKEMEESD